MVGVPIKTSKKLIAELSRGADKFTELASVTNVSLFVSLPEFARKLSNCDFISKRPLRTCPFLLAWRSRTQQCCQVVIRHGPIELCTTTYWDSCVAWLLHYTFTAGSRLANDLVIVSRQTLLHPPLVILPK